MHSFLEAALLAIPVALSAQNVASGPQALRP